jgi:multidrug efflux pump subunit AcrA (membrane-fusion protein)
MRLEAVTLLIASTLFLASASCSRKQEAAAERPPLIQNIRVENVSLTLVDDYYEAIGSVRAATSTVLSARIMGSVLAVRASEGDRVRAGQVLVEIDNRDAAAQLRKAQAGLREAQESLQEVERSTRAAESARSAADAQRQLASKTFERYKTLLERRSVSPQEFDEVQAKHRVAEAEAERAERMLQAVNARNNQLLARIDQANAEITSAQIYAGYAKISSPINGLVTARHTDVGQTASPGVPLLTIEDDSRYRLEVAVEESKTGASHRGDKVVVLIDALVDGELTGKVSEIVPAADAASRSFTLKIDLPAAASKMGARSGMFGRARFAIAQQRVLLVPQGAVVQRGQMTTLFVVDESGIAQLRLIKTGKSYDGRVAVLTGLSEGERIITDGVAAVNEGSRVQ